jgi:hypothetical protein
MKGNLWGEGNISDAIWTGNELVPAITVLLDAAPEAAPKW